MIGPPGSRPKPRQPGWIDPNKTPLIIEVDPAATWPRLQIPRALLEKAGKKKADASDLHGPTLGAGLALSAAFVSGGFWLVRRGTNRSFVIAGLTLAVSAITFTLLYADGVPGPGVKPVSPIPARPNPFGVRPNPFAPAQAKRILPAPANIVLPRDVTVEIVEAGPLKLILPPSLVAQRPGQ